ncbi:MAG: hypothetical protein K2X27_05555 [Candidatus Obscuribacterales bacterium]|nr:hypothetical protein [Candidatus Obscuribacterales bacterium]
MREKLCGMIGSAILTLFTIMFIANTGLKIEKPFTATVHGSTFLILAVLALGSISSLLLPLFHSRRPAFIIAAAAGLNFVCGSGLSLYFELNPPSIEAYQLLLIGFGAGLGLFYWLLSSTFGFPIGEIESPAFLSASKLKEELGTPGMKLCFKPEEKLVIKVLFNHKEIFRQELEAGTEIALDLALPPEDGKAEVFALIGQTEFLLGSAIYSFRPAKNRGLN